MLLLERSCDLSTKVNGTCCAIFVQCFSYLSHLGVLVLDLSFVILFEKPSKTSLLAAQTKAEALANPSKNEKLSKPFIWSSGGGFNYQISFEIFTPIGPIGGNEWK